MKKNMKQLILLGLIQSLSAIAMAASEHGAHQVEGIPTVVYWQIANLTVVILGIIYFTKTPIRSLFLERRSEFMKHAEKAKLVKEEAEKNYLDIKHRLETLKDSHHTNLQQAQVEAENLKQQLLLDAKATAEKIKKDADAAVKEEISKAKRQLKDSIVQEAVFSAKAVLMKDISGPDQMKLQDQFVENIKTI